jgi:protoheme IX farnesyltransferase
MHVSPSDVSRPLNPTWRDYIELTKPQDVLLLMLVSLTALLIAGESVPLISVLLATLIGSCLSAAGAGALNSYLDRDLDALMHRTRNRPLPAERIEPRQAFRFGISLCVLAFFVLGIGANLLAAAIAVLGVVVYVLIYTYWLKRRSMANIFFAGAAWAIPTLVGWAASTGTLTISALSLFAILFYWTPINLWALGLVRLADYTRAGLPTLPVIKGSLTTRKQLVYYSILMIFLTLLPALIGLTDFIYAEAALLLGGVLVFNAFDLFRHPGISGAARLHRYSIVYLALLFVAMMLDRTILN